MAILNNYHRGNSSINSLPESIDHSRKKEGYIVAIPSGGINKRTLNEKSFVVLHVNGSEGINKGSLTRLSLLLPIKNISGNVEMNALVERDDDNNSSSIYQTFYASSYLQNPENSHYRSYNPKQGIHIASFLGTFLILILCFILYKENKFRWCRRKRCSLNSRRDSYEKVLSARLLKRKPHSSMTTASGVMRAGLGAAACALLPGRNEVNRSNLNFDKTQENDNILKIVFGTGPYISRPIQTGPFEIANISSGLYNVGSPMDYDSSPQPDSAYYPGHNSLRSDSEVESALSTGCYDHQVQNVLPNDRLVDDSRLSNNNSNFIKKKFKVPSFLIHHSRSLSKRLSSGKSPKNNSLRRDESLYSYSSSHITPSPIVEPNIHEKQGNKFLYPDLQNNSKSSVPNGNNYKGEVGFGAGNIEKWLMYTHNKMYRRSFSVTENRRVAYPKPIPKLSIPPPDLNSQSLSVYALVSPVSKKSKKPVKSFEHLNGNKTQTRHQSLQLRRKRNYRSRHTIVAKSEANDIFCSNQCSPFPKKPILSKAPRLTSNDLSVPQNDLTPTSNVNVKSKNTFNTLISANDVQYERKHNAYSSAHPLNKQNNFGPESQELNNYSIYRKNSVGNQIKGKIVEYLFGTNVSHPNINGHFKSAHITSPTIISDGKDTVKIY